MVACSPFHYNILLKLCNEVLSGQQLAFAMIDFEISFQVDALLYGDYKNVRLISKVMFRKFMRQFKCKKKSCLRSKTFPDAKETYLLLWTYFSYALLNIRFHIIRVLFL